MHRPGSPRLVPVINCDSSGNVVPLMPWVADGSVSGDGGSGLWDFLHGPQRLTCESAQQLGGGQIGLVWRSPLLLGLDYGKKSWRQCGWLARCNVKWSNGQKRHKVENQNVFVSMESIILVTIVTGTTTQERGTAPAMVASIGTPVCMSCTLPKEASASDTREMASLLFRGSPSSFSSLSVSLSLPPPAFLAPTLAEFCLPDL